MTTTTTTGKAVEVKQSRINPDDPRFIRAITIGVCFAGLVAFLISFVALMEVAAWLGLPMWMHWGVPAFIDTAILVYAGSVLIHKARGEKTWPSWLLLGTFTVVSMIANTAHALSYAHTLSEHWQGLVGAGVAAMVPVAVFAATEQLARVAVEDPVSRRKELQAEAEWAAQHAERERKQLEMEAERERARQEAEIAQEEHKARIEKLRLERDLMLKRASKEADTPSSSPAPTESATGPHLRAVEDTTTKTPTTGKTDQAEVTDYVAQLVVKGKRVSGGALARHFGFSDKTGRRRLEDLKESRPEIFETEGAQAHLNAAEREVA
ncbi:DUF2637 domain-containing protein [Nesterenkonia alkaliphila]|uniref:DUF2637 domain-containing protein n=1 Tax=Nesterenkonia alkaliphila TaxID=1463631 RepID=A0A7K1UHY7_9MICC|nr:DUF2637 domain-containing protein [Nesterenkonia alkaliphila]MVT25711.1 DUF2637 domain-containing protein [Nesterenkonia alkaliphila]